MVVVALDSALADLADVLTTLPNTSPSVIGRPAIVRKCMYPAKIPGRYMQVHNFPVMNNEWSCPGRYSYLDPSWQSSAYLG